MQFLFRWLTEIGWRCGAQRKGSGKAPRAPGLWTAVTASGTVRHAAPLDEGGAAIAPHPPLIYTGIPMAVAGGEVVIKYKSPLNVLKYIRDYSCY